MKFIICRSSEWNDLKPCEEAYRDKYTYVDIRTSDNPAKIPAYLGKPTDWWYGEGENHRVVNGEIARDFPNSEGWFVDVETLEDLMGLYAKYGNLIIRSSLKNPDIPQIEIYDSWRE